VHACQEHFFFVTWLLTACLLLVSGFLEYRGYAFLTTAEALTLISAIGSLTLIVLAFRMFWSANWKGSTLAALGLACSPFVVGVILSLGGAEPNIHGVAIGGLYFHALLCELTAIIFFLSWVVCWILDRR
jgi:hypothetical protein